jgi:Fur family zinc uptake transcriptional regulator
MRTAKKTNQEIVLNVLNNSDKPMSAYQILEKLKRFGIKGPPTVYRALEVLQEQGLVHRLESINAFVACDHHAGAAHPSSFILCKDCGAVSEIHDNRLESILHEWSDKLGFAVIQQTVELLGKCSRCKDTKHETKNA